MDIKKFRGSRTCGGGTHKNRREPETAEAVEKPVAANTTS